MPDDLSPQLFCSQYEKISSSGAQSTALKIGVKVEVNPIGSQSVLLKTGRHLDLHRKDKVDC